MSSKLTIIAFSVINPLAGSEDVCLFFQQSSDSEWGIAGWIWMILTMLLLLMMFAAIQLAGKQKEQERALKKAEETKSSEKIITLKNSDRLNIGAIQHVGKRKDQQDAFGFSEIQNHDSLVNGHISVVADGMGGLQMGHEASTKAVEVFLADFEAGIAEEPADSALLHAIRTANSAVWDLAKEAGHQGNVGTTLVSVYVSDGMLSWISAGDSRIYLFRGKVLTQLTSDHIFLRYLSAHVAQGHITQEEALNHPERDALTSFVGVEEITEIDQNREGFELKDGDKILLCSDGLHGMLKSPEIGEELIKSPKQAAQGLLSRVLHKRNPYQDNTTIVIVAYEPGASAVV